MTHATKQSLIEAGLRLLLLRGYNDLGLQALLDETNIPKGSFYHHFKDKEEFALQVIDAYMGQVHQVLDACLTDSTRTPLARVRHFFENVQQAYRGEGYMGCLLGGLGQELSGVSEVFRRRVEDCFAAIAKRLASCLEQAKASGEIAPDSDVRQIANTLVDCWEGAALRSRLRKNPASLNAMLDFCFSSIAARPGATRKSRGR